MQLSCQFCHPRVYICPFHHNFIKCEYCRHLFARSCFANCIPLKKLQYFRLRMPDDVNISYMTNFWGFKEKGPYVSLFHHNFIKCEYCRHLFARSCFTNCIPLKKLQYFRLRMPDDVKISYMTNFWGFKEKGPYVSLFQHNFIKCEYCRHLFARSCFANCIPLKKLQYFRLRMPDDVNISYMTNFWGFKEKGPYVSLFHHNFIKCEYCRHLFARSCFANCIPLKKLQYFRLRMPDDVKISYMTNFWGFKEKGPYVSLFQHNFIKCEYCRHLFARSCFANCIPLKKLQYFRLRMPDDVNISYMTNFWGFKEKGPYVSLFHHNFIKCEYCRHLFARSCFANCIPLKKLQYFRLRMPDDVNISYMTNFWGFKEKGPYVSLFHHNFIKCEYCRHLFARSCFTNCIPLKKLQYFRLRMPDDVKISYMTNFWGFKEKGPYVSLFQHNFIKCEYCRHLFARSCFANCIPLKICNFFD